MADSSKPRKRESGRIDTLLRLNYDWLQEFTPHTTLCVCSIPLNISLLSHWTNLINLALLLGKPDTPRFPIGQTTSYVRKKQSSKALPQSPLH